MSAEEPSAAGGQPSSGQEGTKKRKGYLEWDEYFMSIAFLSGMRSKDPNTQVGACIVKNDDTNAIAGTGYNGMARGCHDDDMPWGRDAKDPLNDKHTFVCHAEMNAVLNKNSADVKGCRMYTSLFPCNECAKIIIQAGITKVIYYGDKRAHTPHTKASKLMFDKARVKYEEYPKDKLRKMVTLDFDTILTDQAKAKQ